MEQHSDKYIEEYQRLKNEYTVYQNFAESTIQLISENVTKLEKKLDNLYNIIEISKYINSNISDENLIAMINDMIIGILGVTYSSIYIENQGKLFLKTSNISKKQYNYYKVEYAKGLTQGEAFVINCKDDCFCEDDKVGIHSIIGVPIHIRDKLTGYIIVEHALYNFFNDEHIKFISAIANQIGIALENSFLYEKLKKISETDPLLDIYNRKYFFNFVERKFSSSTYKNFAIAMIDIDNFKKFNDIYGHQFGDEVLIQTTDIIKASIEKNDIVARYGGEEIVLYIDEVESREKVYRRIDDMRIKISKNVVQYDNIASSVTVSCGISYCALDTEKLNDVIKIADKMLYESKCSGRNKVTSE